MLQILFVKFNTIAFFM